MTVGYAIFSQSLNINGTAKAKASFGLIFENSNKTPTCRGYSGGGDCTIEQVASISEDGRTLTVDKLLYPTAYVKIPALIKNTGTVDAILESMEITGLDSDDIDVKYSITEEDIKNGYIVKPGNDNRKEVEIEVSWNKDSTYSSDTPLSITFNITMNYKQATNASVTTTSSSESSFPVLMGSLGDNVTFIYNNGNISINGTGPMSEGLKESGGYCDFSFVDSQNCTLIGELYMALKGKIETGNASADQIIELYVPFFMGGNTYESLGITEESFLAVLKSDMGLDDESANKAIEVFNSVPSLKSITMSNGITSIRPYLFQAFNASNLTIKIPNTIASKSLNVFDASRVGTVMFENGTKTIYEGLCDIEDGEINNIIIPEGVINIEKLDFSDGTLSTLIIPSTVENIGEGIDGVIISGQNLTTIVNKTGRAFDWNEILTGTSGEAFVTGTVDYNGRTITITN